MTIILPLNCTRGYFTVILETIIIIIVIVNVKFGMLRVGQREKINSRLTLS